ncbi:MAG: DUF1298 domain-containing protein [Cellulomonadaceae bacterium]|nr:DUF1298 domain-containing protein [Cellulomonadaceae bacterium]
MSTTRSVARLGRGDVVELISDVGPVPRNVGALLVLGAPTSPGTVPADRPDDGVAAEAVEVALRTRASRIPGLMRRLAPPHQGWRRPSWVDGVEPDLDVHVTRELCPGRGDDDALLALAVAVVARPLPRSRPLWGAVVVTGLRGGGLAVVLSMHHALSDGMNALAILAQLVDAPDPGPISGPSGTPASTVRPEHTSLPSPQGSRDVTRGAGLPTRTWSLPRLAPACSLNAITGPRRRVVPVDLALDAVLAAARARGATVNDVLLTVVTRAMARTLDARGEHVDELVVSVLVAARTPPGGHGNQVAVMPVRVPTGGSPVGRLEVVAGRTRALKARGAGRAAPGYAALVRLLAATHLLSPFLNHQRLISTTLTTMRGPTTTLTLAGARVTRVVPLTGTAGNVAVSFAALSYAGRLTVTAVVDPDVVPEVEQLIEAVRDEVCALLDEHPRPPAV